MKPIKNLAFWVNQHKKGAHIITESLIQKAQQLGVATRICLETACPKDFLKNQDACCVIGGDGTILGAVGECIQFDVPVFGVNLGKLGFLATFSAEDILNAFPGIIEGNYQVFERFLLSTRLGNNGNTYYALNDVVIKHKAAFRLMEIDVFANQEYVNSYSCDGIIISTPTGSTAYNLSAGGPIIYPGSNVICLTPICPHTLTNRSVIFDKNKVIHLKGNQEDEEDTFLSLDGGPTFLGKEIFPLSVQIAAEKLLKLLQPLDYSHFKILRNKLRW